MRTELKSVGPGWLGSFIVIALACAALSLWIYSPIYPDEVAFRIARLRFIPDGGMIRGLFAICGPSDLSASVWLRPVAWAFSWLDLRLSAYEFRWLPVGVAIFSVLSVVSYSRSFRKTPISSAVLVGFLGVAGSGLVIARFEYVATAAIAVAVLLLGLAATRKLSFAVAVSFLLLILTTTATSIFVHPQGFLFLPLSVFAMLAVIRSMGTPDSRMGVARILTVGISFAVLFAIVRSAAAGFDYCRGSVEMQSAYASMTIHSLPNSFGALVDFLTNKISNYASSFLFKGDYQVNYLPGVMDANNRGRLSVFNGILLLYIIGLLVAVCVGCVLTLISVARRFWQTGLWRQIWLMQSSVAALMISAPGIVLIVYDNQQYFYRSIFINFIFSIALVLFLVDATKNRKRLAPWLFIGFFALPLIGTIYFNYKTFYYRLSDWSAIYSLPRKTLAAVRIQDVKDLAAQCGIDPSRGGLIVDGSTYDALKRASNLQLIWYIEYQSTISGNSISKIIETSNSPNVVANCGSLERSGVGFPVQHRRGDLCCYRFPLESESE